MGIVHNDKTAPLPAAIREQDASKTSVYQAGKLIYDGATGQACGSAEAASTGPGGSLNEMLKWSIQNSNPGELERRAAAGGHVPSRVDHEILDLMLGQPTVAKMRECMGKLEASEIERSGGLDAAVNALEELEFYVEDMDNANDLAKIGGVQALLYCCSPERVEADLREATCGVLAACLQNNPTFQQAALSLGVPSVLLRLLLEEQEEAEAALPVRRKALYALSAMLRSSSEIATPLLEEPGLVTMLVALSAHSDSKLRRRALFLQLALMQETSLGLQALLQPHANAVAATLDSSANGDDLDARESAVKILLCYAASPDASWMRDALLAAGADARLRVTLSDEEQSQPDASDGNAAHIQKILTWLDHC